MIHNNSAVPTPIRPRALKGFTSTNLKDLIIQHAGNPHRVIFAFDPRRTVILLLGGRKADSKWYKTALPEAEKIYERLETVRSPWNECCFHFLRARSCASITTWN